MADKDFRIDLILGAKFAEGFRALDEAKRKLEGVDKAAGKFSRGAGNAIGTALSVTAAAGVVAASAATAVMGLYIARTIEAEKVQAQLASGIKDTGGIAGRTLAQLNEQSKALSKITVFDDEAIGGVQSVLLTFKEIRGIQLDKATASVLDLSTKLGTDLPGAALQLGKALNDPIRGITALTRAGVGFTEEQKAVIKKLVETGNTAKAQEIILGELESQMGTAAEAARNTLGGAVQALKNSFDDLMEGDSGDTGIVGTRNAIESLITTLNDPSTKQGFDSFVAGLAKIAEFSINALSEVANFTRFVGEEVASRVGGPASDDIIRLEQTRDRNQKVLDQLDQKGTPAARRNTSSYASGLREEISRLNVAIVDAENSVSSPVVRKFNAAYEKASLNFNPNEKPDIRATSGTGKNTKAKAGSKSDPDADIKRRIESLREETALLGQIEEGEDKAREAAKARYDITEGEFKNKSPQLKAEYLAAAEALDAKNKDTDAEKKRLAAIKESQDAYQALMKDLRTPAQVAVDDAIAKLNSLTEAMKRGEAGPNAAKDQKNIFDGAFQKAPDTGFGGYDPLNEIDQKRQALEVWYEEQLSMLAEFRRRRADLTAEADAKEKQLEAEHQAGVLNIQLAQHQLQLAAASSVFGSLAEIARSGAGEQSKAYQVLFAISKGFAIAQAATSLAINIAKASEKGFPENLPLIAAAFAQGAQIASIIAGANYSGGGGGEGYANGGYTGSGGKYEPAGVVHKGEGVLTQDDIAKLGGPTGFYALQKEIQQGRARAILRGYSEGGLAGAAGPALAPPDYSSYPQGAAGMTSGAGGKLSVFNYFDMDAMAQRLARHPAMEKAVVAIASENGQAIQADW